MVAPEPPVPPVPPDPKESTGTSPWHWGVILVLVVALVLLVSSRLPRKRRGEIECDRLILRDDYGNARAVLEVGSKGDVRFILIDGAGAHRAMMRVTAGGKADLTMEEGAGFEE